MVDFLSRLLDRSLDRASVLHRRRPSIFEPVPATGQLDVLSLAGLWRRETTEVESDREVFQPRERDSVHFLQAPTRPFQQILRPTTVVKTKNPKVLPPAKTTAETALSETSAAAQIRHPLVALPREESIAKDAPSFAVSRVIETSSKRARDRQGEEPQTVIRSTTSEKRKEEKPGADLPQLGGAPRPSITPKTRVDQVAEARAQREATDTREAEPFAIKPAKPALQQALAIPKLAKLTRPNPQATTIQGAPLPPPTIEVTIGRIEVRSTQLVSTSPRPSRTVTPKLSLDDYLRSRGGES